MVVEGAVKIVRHENGAVEILAAPPVTRMSLEFLQQSDQHTVRIHGSRVEIAGQVVYEVVEWDPLGRALVAKLVEDRRTP